MCSSILRRPKRPRSPPGTPGPHSTEALSLIRQGAYSPASPTSANKISHFQQQLFSHMPDLRSGTSTSNLDVVTMPPPVHITPNSSSSEQDPGNHTDDEKTEASPRRNNRLPRRPAAADLEDALTRLTQTVQGSPRRPIYLGHVSGLGRHGRRTLNSSLPERQLIHHCSHTWMADGHCSNNRDY